MLQKSFRFTFTPGSPGVSPDPGSPGRPAYTSCEQQEVCKFIINFPLSEENGMLLGHFECTSETVCTFHPAEPPRPATPGQNPTPDQWVADLNLGWNSGAVSITRLAGDVECKFKVPTAAGVFVGFNSVSEGVGYQEIQHAFYFRSGVFSVYESGVDKGNGSFFVPADEFMLRRIRGVVTYYRNSLLIYTSLIPSASSSLIIDSALYSGGDQID